MNSIYFYIAGFLICSAIIVFAGSKLTRYGDIIAELSGMGKAWFGLIMMAAVTSLPELFTGISSTLIFNTPDIAVGDIFGSCVFNLLILGLLDYFVPGKPLLSLITRGHILAALFGIFLLSIAIISILWGNLVPVFGWMSSLSVLSILLYLVAVKMMFNNEKKTAIVPVEKVEVSNKEKGEDYLSIDTAVKWYAFFALLVIAGAIGLPYFADHLAESAGLSKSFVGTLLVAGSTSLPELVVSIAAVRMGSMDMAAGNLFGSNIFNMLILSLDDLMYKDGPILSIATPVHALSALVAIIMTAVAGIGILYGTPVKRFSLGIDAIVLIILYLALMVALYMLN